MNFDTQHLTQQSIYNEALWGMLGLSQNYNGITSPKYGDQAFWDMFYYHSYEFNHSCNLYSNFKKPVLCHRENGIENCKDLAELHNPIKLTTQQNLQPPNDFRVTSGFACKIP